MALTVKNAKALQTKSLSHTVSDLGSGIYQVVSGTSHNIYTVTLFNDGSATCSCPWGTKRHTITTCSCSHVLAAHDVRTRSSDNRRISAWSSLESARRQHRPMINIGDGVILTTRLA